MTRSVLRRPLFVAPVAGLLVGCGSDKAQGQQRPTPPEIASSWDRFYAQWVQPVVHFGTPTLIVFAVLLTVARVLTRVMVTVDSPGPRGAHLRDRARMSTMYWIGVLALFWASIEATVVYPLNRNETHPRWMVIVSLVVIALSGGVVVTLFAVVGRPRKRQVFGVPVEGGPIARALAHARLMAAAWVGTVLIAIAVFLAVECYANVPISFRWLNTQAAPVAYAPVLAALGLVVVGRARGIGLGLMIQGHDKSGAEDGGLGAFVRARLYALGSDGPTGIQITQRTDVSTLPSEALSLIPEGTLAKLVQSLAQLFTPATPWRVDVTEQSDGSVVVSMQRNGSVAEAVVIRPSVIMLPSVRSSDSTRADPTLAPTPADWTMELRTAAASFVLLALAKRYYHLQAGLSGASDWRGVALQVIAADPASRLGRQEKREILARAVGFDGGNVAAELALVYDTQSSTRDRDGVERYITKLTELLERLSNEEGMTPLRLRVRFNLAVASINYAASFTPPADQRRPSTAPESQPAREALVLAAGQTRRLIYYWTYERNRRTYPALWADMSDPVAFVASNVTAEWRRQFSDPPPPGLASKQTLPVGEHMTLFAQYERACLLVTQAAVAPFAEQEQLYEQALDDLQMTSSVRSYQVQARDDPSLLDLHDVTTIAQRHRQGSAPGGSAGSGASPGSGPSEVYARRVVRRFKSLVGDPAPRAFFELPPLAKYKSVLDEGGVHDAGQLIDSAAGLGAQLGTSDAVADRLVALARFYEFLAGQPSVRRTPDRDATATGFAFLLLQVDLDTAERLRAWVTAHSREQLRAALLEHSRAWDLVAPLPINVGEWVDS